MTRVSFFIHGIFPRSESLIKVSRDFDRKRITADNLKGQQKKDTQQLINYQKKLKFPLIEDGKISWQDIFRPFATNSGGIKLGSLTRHFDNNTFFRQPIISGRIKFDCPKILKYFSTGKAVTKTTLPSPFYLSKICKNLYYKKWESLLIALTREFKKLTKDLEAAGYSFIQFNDPYLGSHPIKKRDLLIFKKAMQQFKEGLKVKIGLHTFFGDGAKIFKSLVNFPVDAIGFDFFKTSLEDLPTKRLNKNIICGCFNSRSPVIENATVVGQFVKKLIKKFSPPVVFLTSTSDLEPITAKVAYKKMALLPKIAKNLL